MATATYIGRDSTTKGNWLGVYGATGRAVCNDTSTQAPNLTVTITQASTFTWADNPADVRAPLKPSNTAQRLASVWYHAGVAKLTAAISSGAPYLSLYFLDWDHNGRSATINVYDNATNALLDTRALTNARYDGGAWYTWLLGGAGETVRVEVVNLAGGSNNAGPSGWFVDTAYSGIPDDETVFARVSQVVGEVARVFDPATVPAQLSQATVEAVRTFDATTLQARVSQGVVEVLRSSAAAPLDVRLSQVAVEVVRSAIPPVEGALAQAVVEVLVRPPSQGVLSQAVVEVVREVLPSEELAATQLVAELAARTSDSAITATQLLVEIAWHHQPLPPAAQVTQLLIEIIRRPITGPVPPHPPRTSACSAALPIDGGVPEGDLASVASRPDAFDCGCPTPPRRSPTSRR